MSTTDQLRRGMVLRHQGNLYTVLDFWTAQSGKQRPTVHLKLRSVNHGNPVDRSLDELGRIDEVPAEVRMMQYLYAAGGDRVFMDNETFEESSFAPNFLGSAIDFLVESDSYRFLFVDGRPVSIQLPPVVAIAIAETAPVEHAGGTSNIHKEAKLSSGITVQVPLFIKTGDKIKIKVDTKEYQGKEH